MISFKVYLAAVITAAAVTAHAETPRITISPAPQHAFLITYDQTVGGRSPHTTHVEMRVPRDLYVIPASKIISFHLHERYANGDESRRDSAGTIGFLLRSSDERGATLEIRLVEKYDKHDWVASEINGVYRVKYP